MGQVRSKGERFDHCAESPGIKSDRFDRDRYARSAAKIERRVVDGKPLNTAGAQLTEIKMSPAERVFQKLWRPEVMFILMLIAIYGIIGELTSPGAILPGVVGAIALILALYLAAILPVNVAGLVLIALAMMLFIFDLYTPTHGVLTVGGVLAFLIGSLMLFDRADPLFRLSLSFIIPATPRQPPGFSFSSSEKDCARNSCR